MRTFSRNKYTSLGFFAAIAMFIVFALVIEGGLLNRSLPGGARQVWHVGGLFYIFGLFMLVSGLWTLRTPLVSVDDAGIKMNLALLRKPFVPFDQLQSIELIGEKVALIQTKAGKKYKLGLNAFSPEGKQGFLSFVASRTQP